MPLAGFRAGRVPVGIPPRTRRSSDRPYRDLASQEPKGDSNSLIPAGVPTKCPARGIAVRTLLLLLLIFTAWSNALAATRSANGESYPASMASDGRYILFESDASDLVPNDTNGFRDVFLRDLQTKTTTLVTPNLAATGSGNNASYASAITPDGRYILFESRASDLVDNDTNVYQDIFVS